MTPTLSPLAFSLLTILRYHAGTRDRAMSRTTLAAHLAVHDRRVRALIRELRRAGYVIRAREDGGYWHSTEDADARAVHAALVARALDELTTANELARKHPGVCGRQLVMLEATA